VEGQDSVRQDLEQGRADEALRNLAKLLAQNPKDAEAHNLRCRVYYQEERWDQAIAGCEAAVQLAPGNSNFHLWLGRAYGQKAAHASIVSAYPLARKVHAEFEQAVQLDPHNPEALADLGEFDVMAPAVVGGGVARAEAVVQQLRSVRPAGALTLEARIAEAKKDYASAETDLKNAIRQSSCPANAWMDLAAFYRRRARLDEMATAAHTGASLDPNRGPALVDGASNLALAGREPQTAIQWLQQYLNSHAQSETAPAFVVRAQLAHLLQNLGDIDAAQKQLAVVHALASAYRIPSVLNASARTGL
jgi:tetratricopeptide (TPR) repeat protein